MRTEPHWYGGLKKKGRPGKSDGVWNLPLARYRYVVTVLG